MATAVLIGAIWFVKDQQEHASGDNPTQSSSSSSASPVMKKITVTGYASDSVKFSNWHTEGYVLFATAVWDGSQKFDSMTYTVKRDGVVKNRGNVHVPGDHLIKNELFEVTIGLDEDPTGLEVAVVVGP